jgi:hypothetical protein
MFSVRTEWKLVAFFFSFFGAALERFLPGRRGIKKGNKFIHDSRTDQWAWLHCIKALSARLPFKGL